MSFRQIICEAIPARKSVIEIGKDLRDYERWATQHGLNPELESTGRAWRQSQRGEQREMYADAA